MNSDLFLGENKVFVGSFNEASFSLYQGDCLSLLKKMPKDSVDMVFADPPYFINKASWDVSQGFEKDLDFHFQWVKACRRVLKSNGTIWVSGTHHSIYQCGYVLQVEGFKILNDIVWLKPNARPNRACRSFTGSHEVLLWAKKDVKQKHTFNYDLTKKFTNKNDWLKRPNRQMRSVWIVHPPGKREQVYGKHPTQKPVDLLKRIVMFSTKKGDVVLDPFTGSSTSGLVACSNGRNFIGIDCKSEFLKLSEIRFKTLEGYVINYFKYE